MTFEKQCLIEASDFISVRYECGKCGAALVVPIEMIDINLASTYAMRDCHYCHAKTGYSAESPEMDAFLQFNRYLKKFFELSKSRDLKLKINIKCAD